jgi:hypothetical protein
MINETSGNKSDESDQGEDEDSRNPELSQAKKLPSLNEGGVKIMGRGQFNVLTDTIQKMKT